MDEYEYEDIEQEYYYDNKLKKTKVRFFPDKSIATITETTFTGDESIEVGIVEEGMTREELEEYFPPMTIHQNFGNTFNLSKIIRSVIYEAYVKEGINIEEGNVRNFWYTHLKKIITEILGLGETDTVLSSINDSWGQMINSGLVNYEGMNIVGGKEDSRLSVVKDSPFSNLIVAVEKVDYFHKYKWIPRLFNSTLITAGGQPSRTVARAFIRQLKDLGVNLDQNFFMCTVSDLDPAGYYIQDAFRKQFESALEYYGGSGSVEIRRLFVRRDQVTDELLSAQAMPCRDKAKSDSAKKAEDTKWEYFCRETNGGIYISTNGKQVRALLEMNAFSKEVIEQSIIKELLKIIFETNDESKIMIPEMMRVFEEMKLDVSESIYEYWKKQLIQPLINHFLDDTDKWSTQISNIYWENKDTIEERYDEQIDELNKEAREQEPELYEQKDDLEEKISELENKLSDIDAEIGEKCSEIFEKVEALESEKEDEITIERNKREYREKKLEEFKDEKATVFNPLEQELKNNILEYATTSTELLFYFKDIEQMNRFRPHIGRLLTQPNLLLVDNLSCFEHPVNTFTETDLLHKASKVKDENVGNVRNAFPKVFTDEMKKFISEIMQKKTFSIDEDKVEYTDLSEEVKQAMDTTEEAIDDGSWEE